MSRLTVAEIVAQTLTNAEIPYVAGIPGHGILALVDAFRRHQDRLRVIQVRHEQAAAHLADGYYRATGRPIALYTSVGPGAINTLVGLATSYADSTAMVLFSASYPTYMRHKGALQEIDRAERTGFSEVADMMTSAAKATFTILNPQEAPAILDQALRTAVSGRPGPVHVELPMDIQVARVDGVAPTMDCWLQRASVEPDPDAIRRAAACLARAKRPAILAGGGVITGEATEELNHFAQLWQAPIITTLMGKGAVPEDHPLAAFYAGSKGSVPGMTISRGADMLLAVGYRFAEWSSSSFKPGVTFNIPPSQVVQIDIDPCEVGKNYPVIEGIIADAKSALRALAEALSIEFRGQGPQRDAYMAELDQLKRQWSNQLAGYQEQKADLMTSSRFLKELRDALPRDAILVGGAGHAQAQLFQEFPVYLPRTHLSSGAYSTMGFTVPAAIGAKLGRPERPVVAVCGDGDFLMTCQELATAVQYNVPVIYCVINNFGWISIRDLQIGLYGPDRTYATEFANNGRLTNPDFTQLARAFGVYAERVQQADQVVPAMQRAMSQKGPALLEILVDRQYPASEGAVLGFADLPLP